MADLRIKCLIVKHVSKRQPIVAIRDAVFTGGHLWAILAPNLSGRTAMLRALAGELQHSNAFGVHLEAGFAETNKNRAMSFDAVHDAVYLGPSPENLISGLAETVDAEIEMHKSCASSKSATDATVDFTDGIESLGLRDLLNRHPLELSGGQMAAVCLICALALRRPLVCIDGLLGQLDVEKRKAAYGLLSTYAASGALVLVAENDLDWAAKYAGFAMLLNDGQSELAGPAPEVLRQERTIKAGCATTATRYANTLAPNSAQRLPLTEEDFISWLKEEYGLA